jgi:hypothetical protein
VTQLWRSRGCRRLSATTSSSTLLTSRTTFRHDTSIASEESLAAGPVTVLYDFACDGGKPGSGATGAIFVNGKKVRDRPDPTHDPVSLRN